jgi:hypothetical protein
MFFLLETALLQNYRINNTSGFVQGNCGNDCPKKAAFQSCSNGFYSLSSEKTTMFTRPGNYMASQTPLSLPHFSHHHGESTFYTVIVPGEYLPNMVPGIRYL